MFASAGTYILPLLSLTAFWATQTSAQTYSSCNPLTQAGCPADPALGKSANIDFSSGASSQFTNSGAPTYDSNGAAFTVAKSGDSPTITSKWYIMFGHVDFIVKSAPGTGIVSSAILQSDCLDEIDWEWLGGDNSQAQSNYFGKGQTSTGYNRGAFHAAANNHDSFNTYSIDWTADQIVWQVNGVTVRALKATDAETGQYPQTPMQIRVGSWAGGDSANPQGTIEWAGGLTDYSKGPFTMYLKAMHVTDYSTGTSYSYSGTTGTWQSINSNGGKIGSGSGGTAAVVETPAVSTATGAPIPFSTDSAASSVYATRTGYPWVTSSYSAVTTTASSVYTSINGLPSGWTVAPDGKTVSLSLSSSQVCYAVSQLSSGLEVRTSYDEQGFPTTVTVDSAQATQSKSYDSQGFEVTQTSSTGSCSDVIVTATLVLSSTSTTTNLATTQSSSTVPSTANVQISSAQQSTISQRTSTSQSMSTSTRAATTSSTDSTPQGALSSTAMRPQNVSRLAVIIGMGLGFGIALLS